MTYTSHTLKWAISSAEYLRADSAGVRRTFAGRSAESAGKYCWRKFAGSARNRADSARIRANSRRKFFRRANSLKVHIISGAYTRARVSDEIVPESATASYSPNSYYGPRYAIDLQMTSYSYTTRGYGSTTWLKIHLGGLYCVKHVTEYANTGFPWTVWTCNSDSKCHCSGGGYYSTSSCDSTTVSIHTEDYKKKNLPNVLGCKYGDTVMLYKSSGADMSFYELTVTGNRGMYGE